MEEDYEMMLSRRQMELLESALSRAMWQAYCDGETDLMLELAGTMKQIAACP
jgi:hypothetical protein